MLAAVKTAGNVNYLFLSPTMDSNLDLRTIYAYFNAESSIFLLTRNKQVVEFWSQPLNNGNGNLSLTNDLFILELG